MSSTEDRVVQLRNVCQKIVDGTKDVSVKHTNEVLQMEDAYGLLEGLEQLPVTIDVLTVSAAGWWKSSENADRHDGERAAEEDQRREAGQEGQGLDQEVEGTDRREGEVDRGRAREAQVGHTAARQQRQAVRRAADPAQGVQAECGRGQRRGEAGGGWGNAFRALQSRCKSITALTNALKSGELPDGTQDPEELAERIEEAVFQAVGGVNDRYRSAVRSRLFNLRDKKNLALRENVLTGAVTAKRFASMTAEEMASDEMKKQREAFTKEAIMEHQMSVQEGTPSDMFRCGRCGKNNCTYTQVQTRSADEPMTTFVFCRTCGNRWKFC